MGKKILTFSFLILTLLFSMFLVYAEDQASQPGVEAQTNFSEPTPMPAPGMNPKINNSNGTNPPRIVGPPYVSSPNGNAKTIRNRYRFNYSYEGPLCPELNEDAFTNRPYPWYARCNYTIDEELMKRLKECWDGNTEIIIFGNITCGELMKAREGNYENWEERMIEIKKIKEEKRAEIEEKIEMLREQAKERRKQIQEQRKEMWKIRAENYSAYCDCDLFMKEIGNWTVFCTNMSNGENSCVKIMPDVAGEKAIDVLKLKKCHEDDEGNCALVLKEVGQKMAYEMQGEKQVRLFGFIKTRMEVRAQIDAENGEIIDVNKPWWTFLASESVSNEDVDLE